jgi:ParB-like chromosome segregation protein Spo0J
MVAAISEFGFRIPIVVKSDGLIVDGHLRYKAARHLGLTEVPVVLADELSDEQIKAFRLLANRSANWAQWDNELLKLEFQELEDLGYDLKLTGFNENEIDNLMNLPDFSGVSEDEQGKLDEKCKIKCPRCGHEFET